MSSPARAVHPYHKRVPELNHFQWHTQKRWHSLETAQLTSLCYSYWDLGGRLIRQLPLIVVQGVLASYLRIMFSDTTAVFICGLGLYKEAYRVADTFMIKVWGYRSVSSHKSMNFVMSWEWYSKLYFAVEHITQIFLAILVCPNEEVILIWLDYFISLPLIWTR